MKKILYYDCFAGISGDMNLGALVDLGVDPGHLEKELGKLNIEGFRLAMEKDKRKGISGTRVSVVIDNPENEKHRHLRDIEKLINESTLSEEVQSKSLSIFNRVATAEAKVHNIAINEVHFHEVGALDSIADIVGAAICQAYLEVDEIQASPVQLGGGFVECAHGTMPVPAPATAEILRGIPVRTGLIDYEATTPTGAAILAATVDHFREETDWVISATGYGIGQRDGKIPNVLRVYLGETGVSEKKDLVEKEAVMLECNMDDMNPEWYAYISDLLFEAGAADVYTTPVVMKKSRPGHMLSVLCDRGKTGKVKEILFTGTSTIGLREYPVNKNMLRREMVEVKTRYGKVDVKRSYYNGRVVNEKPEFEQCRLLAKKYHISLEEIRKEVYKNL